MGGKGKTEQEKFVELFWTTENLDGMISFYSYIIYVPVPQSSWRAEIHWLFCLLLGKEGAGSWSRGSKVTFLHLQQSKPQGTIQESSVVGGTAPRHHPRVLSISRWRHRATSEIASSLQEGVLPPHGDTALLQECFYHLQVGFNSPSSSPHELPSNPRWERLLF